MNCKCGLKSFHIPPAAVIPQADHPTPEGTLAVQHYLLGLSEEYQYALFNSFFFFFNHTATQAEPAQRNPDQGMEHITFNRTGGKRSI